MTQIPHTDEPPAPQRVSGLAVASLVFGLLCCIPGSGLIGVILGGAGLVRIGQSQGRLSGRPMALIGIVLGLLGTLFYLGSTIGVMGALNSLNAYGDVARALDQKNHPAVRDMLAPSVSGAVTDEQIDAFADRIRGEWGAYRGLPKGLPEWFSSYAAVVQVLERAGVSAGGEILPVPLLYDRGTAAGIFKIDRGATGPGGAAAARDIGVAAKDGSLMWLLDSKAPPPADPSRAPGGG